jgi:hypothetical protein
MAGDPLPFSGQASGYGGSRGGVATLRGGGDACRGRNRLGHYTRDSSHDSATAFAGPSSWAPQGEEERELHSPAVKISHLSSANAVGSAGPSPSSSPEPVRTA